MFVLTAQQWFDLAWERAKDKRRSLSPRDGQENRCSYPAHGDVPGCFIGVALPKELALKFDTVNWGAYELVTDSKIGVDMRADQDFSPAHFLSELQNIHDQQGPSEWREALLTFARDYDLTTPKEN